MKLFLTILLFILTAPYIAAQDIQGVVRYQTDVRFPIYQEKLDDPSTSLEKRKYLENAMRTLRDVFEYTYTLTFNQYESLFEVEDKLALRTKDGAPSHAYGDYYKNFSDKIYIQKNDVFGRIYFVSEPLRQFDWKLHDETKMIGKYLCRKATHTEKQELSEPIQREDGTFDNKMVEKGITKTAWYAAQIPLMNGPYEYGGLPGLIMEVSDNRESYIAITIRCIEVNLQPENEVKIKRPKGKRMVTRAELRAEIERF